MMHIENICWDDEDARIWSNLEKAAKRDDMSGPCDDDYESTSPFVDMLPEESGKENGSPLNFGEHAFAESYDAILRRGW
jgi:hypothetical protein